MTLKYKLGDMVVLGENVDTYKSFAPGAIVRIGDLCNTGASGEHYTVYTIDGKSSRWWVNDDEINHKATEELQKSNETGDIVGKTEAVSDDNAQEVQTPALEENASQTTLQPQDDSWYKNGELPPVNTKCIFTGVDSVVEGVIVAHVEYKGQYSAIIQCDGDWWIGETREFRPWCSDEEIAKQEREAYRDRIYAILCEENSRSDMAESLYDAGLRFAGEDK